MCHMCIDCCCCPVGIVCEMQVSGTMQALLHVLDMLSSWVDEIPPAAHTLRYGNPAFRTWFARMAEQVRCARAGIVILVLPAVAILCVPMVENALTCCQPETHPFSTATTQAPTLLASVLPAHLQHALPELVPCFVDSFGNATRIDYGTGKDSMFVDEGRQQPGLRRISCAAWRCRSRNHLLCAAVLPCPPGAADSRGCPGRSYPGVCSLPVAHAKSAGEALWTVCEWGSLTRHKGREAHLTMRMGQLN